MDKPVTTPFSIMAYFQNLVNGLKGSAVGTVSPTNYHGSSSMRGRRSNAGHVRATKKHQRYRAHMKSLRR